MLRISNEQLWVSTKGPGGVADVRFYLTAFPKHPTPGAPHLLNLDEFHLCFKNQCDVEDTLFAATTATNATELYFSSEEVDEQFLT